MEGVTDAQLSVLRSFKESVADVLLSSDTDAHLLKGLKARNFNLKRAEKIFREMQAYKKVYGINEAFLDLYQMPEATEKYEWTAFLGHAKDGSIVRFSAGGTADFLGFLMSMSGYDIGLYASHIFESDLARQREYNEKTGKSINEITYIFDMEGFSIQSIIHRCAIETGFDLLYLLQDYYPEVWGNIFFVNAPAYFDVAFNIFKPILRMNIIQKLKVASREHTAQVLLKYIDADILPAYLGGTRVDLNGDPRCSEFLRFGGKIPERYYLQERPQIQPTDPGVVDTWLGARSCFEHSVEVEKPDSRIRTEFRTENGSIHLRILFKGKNQGLDSEDELCEEGGLRLVSPPLRLQSHISPPDHTMSAPWPGTYIFQFNNCHSWFHSRRVIYRITLIEPEI